MPFLHRGLSPTCMASTTATSPATSRRCLQEQASSNYRKLPGPRRLFPSSSLFPGHFVASFDAAWNVIAAGWKTHQGACPGGEDRWYVESHLLAGNDVLVTDDRALRAMCDRLSVEHGLTVVAESLNEFVRKLA